jgi:putative transposase
MPGMDLYHLLNRGVDKRTLFLDEQDYKRFVSGLELFNDTRSIEKVFRSLNSKKDRLTKSDIKEALVDIHSWCVMRNHYHLLVSEKVDGGITKFLRKLNIGYSKYFNKNYKRSGTLLQARTKKVLIETDPHFLHILNYIHLNPLDYHRDTKDWRKGKIEDVSKSTLYLEKYRWSSYHNY